MLEHTYNRLRSILSKGQLLKLGEDSVLYYDRLELKFELDPSLPIPEDTRSVELRLEWRAWGAGLTFAVDL